MLDERVLEAQQWVNATYGGLPGYVRCAESGRTGWATMYSLTRALQFELGIVTLSDSFGPATLSRLVDRGSLRPGYPYPNIVRIAQHGLYCKGYAAGETTTGTYHLATQAGVRRMQSDCGLPLTGEITAKVFKAILTMDAYVLLSGGSDDIRGIQQWLNSRYIDRSTFFVGPCDGHYSRDVQTALMKAIQYESGIPEDQANGNFGPSTQAGLRRNRVGPGWTGTWVQLFSAACVFNGVVDDTRTVFKSVWDAALTTYVTAFQDFSVLERTRVADYQTWAQLLVSTGDPDRPASACDTRFHIDRARAAALFAAGYFHIGRYLDEDPTSTLDKEIQPGELDAIFSAGLRVFPISQYNSRTLGDFTYAQGQNHAARAHDRAVGYGLDRGSVIYFAVDFDATDEQITSNIVPYFRGVQSGLAAKGRRYIAAVYGSRNVCARVSSEAYARYSFVSGMSYGFSGNLGFPMPANWSFNQIKEFRFGSGADSFDLDRDVHRPGSDRGVGFENVGTEKSPLDIYFKYLDDLYDTAVRYGVGDPNLRVMEYLRFPTYVDLYDGWKTLVGDVDRDWIAYADSNGPPRVRTYEDPSFGVTINADHFGATANAEFVVGGATGAAIADGDFGGWGGDLSTFYAEWRNNLDSYPSGRAFCADRLAKLDVASSFDLGDLIEDADGQYVGGQLRTFGGRINEVVRARLTGSGHTVRFDRFYARFGATADGVKTTARNLLLVEAGVLASLRTLAIRNTGGLCLLPAQLPAAELDSFLDGFADTLHQLSRG